MSSGTDAGSTTSEWYRAAVKGLGMPANKSSPLCLMADALPCLGFLARVMRMPYAAPIHW